MNQEIKKEFKRLRIRQNEIEQEVKLGTVDSAFLAIIILTISGFLSLRFFDVVTSIQNQYLLVMYVYLVILIPAIIYAVIYYPSSIFSSRNRFTIKLDVFTFLLGSLLFIFLIWFLIGIFWFVEQILHLVISKSLTEISIFSVLIITIILTSIWIRSSLRKYFLNDFPNLLLKKINKMNQKNRKKALKKFRISYSGLKRKAGYY